MDDTSKENPFIYLNLDSNQLKVITNETFRGLSRTLNKLELTRNNLSQIDSNAFNNFCDLNDLIIEKKLFQINKTNCFFIFKKFKHFWLILFESCHYILYLPNKNTSIP